MSGPANHGGDHDDEHDDEQGEAPERLSSKDWLARCRELRPAEPASAMRPVPPSPRFTWGVRGGIVLAAVFYSVLGVWNRHDAGEPRLLDTVLLAVAGVLAAVALVEAWRWAGRLRLSASSTDAVTADLPLEAKKTVRRMARGRGPDVLELRPWAALYAWAQQQNMGLAPAGLALVNVGNLSQSSGRVFGLVLGAIFLPLTAGSLGWSLWLGRRARLLAVHLPTDPTVPSADSEST